MNLQIAAILSNGDRTSDQSITHYQILHLDTFNLATLSKQQVIVMVESVDVTGNFLIHHKFGNAMYGYMLTARDCDNFAI